MIQERTSTRFFDLALGVDLAERILVTLLFLNLCTKFVGASIHQLNLVYLLIVLSEFCNVALILLRGVAKQVSLHVQDWAVAALGTGLPLTALPHGPSPVAPLVVCTGLILFGIVFQLTSKLFLNRSFGIVPANRGVRTRGPYAFIRHPIYCGYTLTHIGFLLFAPNLWNLSVYVLAFACQISRVFREERVLSQDAGYRNYMEAVPYRLLPWIF